MQKSGRANIDSNNKNSHVTDLLEKMLERYEAEGDQWRVLSYRKAIQTLKRHSTRIESGEQAREIHGIGGKIADKVGFRIMVLCNEQGSIRLLQIEEIISTGRLRKVEHVPEQLSVLAMFQKIHGIGSSIVLLNREIYEANIMSGCGINIARKWYAQGFRTLEDLKTKAQLSHDQQVGLKYYGVRRRLELLSRLHPV